MSQLKIEVVYANSKTALCLSIQVEPSCTILQAIEQSGILQLFPEIDLHKTNKVGIFGKLKSLQEKLSDGDRVEIYRPLTVDAMAARINRSNQQKAKRLLQTKNRE
ncbi:MAG: RnfH family protein [Gammaproteobacteria bacterium]|jgi:putative ubiquitin-RnfH superfamily antitoxin RatB of RatAB toxin-antitoxin module|nr:RnfH family protein [Gammaproteobacteria bacterium]